MKYKYRCISRFPLLLDIDGKLITVRPNQILESDVELGYDLLKRIVEKTSTPKKPRKKPTKEIKNGNNSSS